MTHDFRMLSTRLILASGTLPVRMAHTQRSFPCTKKKTSSFLMLQMATDKSCGKELRNIATRETDMLQTSFPSSFLYSVSTFSIQLLYGLYTPPPVCISFYTPCHIRHPAAVRPWHLCPSSPVYLQRAFGIFRMYVRASCR